MTHTSINNDIYEENKKEKSEMYMLSKQVAILTVMRLRILYLLTN